jgi:hypothetical protein
MPVRRYARQKREVIQAYLAELQQSEIPLTIDEELAQRLQAFKLQPAGGPTGQVFPDSTPTLPWGGRIYGPTSAVALDNDVIQ